MCPCTASCLTYIFLEDHKDLYTSSPFGLARIAEDACTRVSTYTVCCWRRSYSIPCFAPRWCAPLYSLVGPLRRIFGFLTLTELQTFCVYEKLLEHLKAPLLDTDLFKLGHWTRSALFEGETWLLQWSGRIKRYVLLLVDKHLTFWSPEISFIQSFGFSDGLITIAYFSPKHSQGFITDVCDVETTTRLMHFLGAVLILWWW